MATIACADSSTIDLQEITKDFEHSYSDMVGGFLEQVQSQYPPMTVVSAQSFIPNVYEQIVHLDSDTA